MWICNHCHTENKDSFTMCEQCGSMRSAGRFGSAPTVMRPQISTPGAGISPSPVHQQEVRQAVPVRRAMQAPAKIIGWLLLILLPVLTGLLFWRQYDVLRAALVPLLVDQDAAEVWQILCYAGYALIAVLLATLPGLRTLQQYPKRPRKKG